jgi:type I restriction enzyme, S subunit
MNDEPSGWRSVPLREAGTWLSGGTPATDDPRYWDGDIPWISAASLKDFHISRSDRCITELGSHAGTRLVPPGTVLFVVRGMSLKTEFRVGITERQVAFGQDCKAILPAPSIGGKFLALALNARSQHVLAMVDEAGHGTGRLPTDLISKLEIGIPKLAEQRQITEILDSVDEQATASERCAKKLEQIEWAILSDLIGNGIRSASSGTADWYWGIVRDTGTVQLGRQRSPEHESGRFMAPYLRVANVHDGYIDYSDVLTMNFSPAERQIYDLRPGDILLNEGQSLELVGRCAIYDGLDDIYFQNTLIRYRSDVLLPEFARAIFKYWLETGEFTKIAKRTTSVAHLGASRFAQMPIPITSREEQLRIVNTLTAASHRVAQEQTTIRKLRLLKQGLMDDLLTGRVRVTIKSVPGD